MIDAVTTEPGTFGKFVIEEINNKLKTTERVCKKLWYNNHEECLFRRTDEAPSIIMCKYPERINSTRRTNCVYKFCPLINRNREGR